MAAYPIMMKQGFGHIMNTASLAELAPSPSFTAYSATKHAVMGLTRRLRAEAKGYGVKVSVACPGFIETPLKDNAKLVKVDKEKAETLNPFKFYNVDLCARDILRGVARNDHHIVVTSHGKIAYFVQRLAPWLIDHFAAKASADSRKAHATMLHSLF